jgi:biotin synthase-related radical SAM superfamily protein
MLGNLCKPSSNFIGSLTLDQEEKRATLQFFQDTEYRRVDLLKIEMEACEEETLKNLITYRISSTKQKTTLMQERLKDVMSIVKAKNPVLMQEIYRGSFGGAKTA